MELHAVIIKNTIPLNEAKKISKQFIPDNRNYYRETKNTYRFRNIPKTKFKKKRFGIWPYFDPIFKKNVKMNPQTQKSKVNSPKPRN